jgi:hypothetical protein
MANISNIDFIKIGIDQNGVVHYVNASGAWDILPLGGSGDCCGGTIEAEGNVTIESTGGSVGVDALDEINIEAINNTFLGSVNGTVTVQSRGNATLQSTNGNLLLNSPNGNVVVNGVKVYKALLTQVELEAPVATVLENSLGGTIVWSRDSAGFYIGSLVGVFPNELKVFSLLGMQKNDNDVVFQQGWNDADSIYVATYNIDGGTVLADSLLINTSILIEVYP